MKKKNIIIFYASVFVLMFVLRFIYGYAKYSDSSYTVFSDNDAVMESVRNYASDKIKVTKEGLPQGSPSSIDQKYEKIANLRFLSIGPKSVNAPTPMKIIGGKKPVLMSK